MFDYIIPPVPPFPPRVSPSEFHVVMYPQQQQESLCFISNVLLYFLAMNHLTEGRRQYHYETSGYNCDATQSVLPVLSFCYAPFIIEAFLEIGITACTL